ncbi:uncharacterized protein LOC127862509 [Dreissena polymorpha]|nr:uncharacterized protein LOC127862509 [Dreissena polymorpha]XP_052257623.1 uncharacterized protein LOC127862509 [Dreissena polymorpha]
MGNSADGKLSIDTLGIEIYTFDREVSVVVCNQETGSSGCYSALPVDVTGTEYYTVSMPWENETSAFMVIAQRDATQVNITIPSASGHVVDSFNAGSTFSVTLDKRRTVYVSQLVADENNAHVCGYRIVSSKPVSVISGNVNYETDHMVDQIPPVEKFGDHYVLAPAIPRDDTRSTKYIIQAINTGTTEVKFYTSSSPLNSTTYNISTAQNPPLILEVQSSSPGELTSDKPIFVTQVVANNLPKGVQHAMVVLPSIQQWSSTYVINSPMTSYSLGVVYHNSSNIYVSSQLIIPLIVKEVNGQGRYKFANIQIPPQQVLRILSCDSPCLFIAYTWSNLNDGAALVLPGTRYSNFDYCEPVGLRGDLMDNDCDGYIDEEIVDGVDNDKDGLIDEDAIGHAKENLAAVAIRPINCKVSGDSTFNVFQQITGSNGCIIPDQPFLPAKNFTPVTGSNIGNGTQTKILYSGVFEISMFIDKAQLFFMCDIGHYCLSALDTSCTTSICTPSKKRSVEDENLDNITVGVFVFPYNAQSSQWNISSGNTDTLSSLEVCIKNDAIILITTLPLALAALCCCLAVFVCMLYRKQLKRNASDAPKY